ncbi:DUF805 domain-containing protein [Acinetobacter terrestris]|jgi:uncharacterized membrane protein YhaH (DUF805 family)|uniref:DUF805 domain-containing protein n=1 Tax=Acinetobacter terrestris TaxID=2529843 RepID=UPI00103A89F6|nr:DUF805 domain-containing protein [Acinetobacter terrestris]TCB67261.1 DUF805 domain-containing protein [Acinetobacter terrestris]
MKGSILDFSIQTNTGIISGDDQNRYNFTGAEWRGQRPPARGDRVDFDVDNAGSAIQIFTALGHSNPVQNISNQLDKLSDQNKAEEQFNMIDWFVKGLKNYANFKGRARRKEYWFFVLCQFLLIFIAAIIDSILFDNPALFYSITALGLFIPSLAVAVRRMHDIGKSGWLLLLSLIPLIGLIVIFWLASETKQENNQWGQPAK